MVSAVILTISGLLGFGGYFEEFLYVLGDLMLPTMGVILADYWIINKAKPENFKVTDGFNWIGIVSWLVGYAVIKFIPYGVPFAQGIIASGVLYVILAKTIKRPQDKEA